jgi:hypothetical protein
LWSILPAGLPLLKVSAQVSPLKERGHDENDSSEGQELATIDRKPRFPWLMKELGDKVEHPKQHTEVHPPGSCEAFKIVGDLAK